MKTLNRKHISSIWLICCLLLGVAGLAAGSFFDLPINQFLYSPDAFWAQLFAAAAPVPVFWGIGAAGFLIIDVLRDGHNAISGWIIGFVLLAVGPVYMAKSFMDEMAMNWILAWIIGLLLSELPALLYAWVMRNASRESKIRCIAILLIVCIGSMLIVQVVKRVFLRPRYFVMQENSALPFIPWYSPDRSVAANFNALYEMDHDFFRSFPSGHAQSITCLFLWALIPVYTQKGSVDLTMAIALILTVAGMVSRLVMGAHFLSDVSAGYLITFLLFAICCWSFGLTRSHARVKDAAEE